MNAGLSFMVRIRDEEATLYESIRSLRHLSVPHEIILILHQCTDRSPEIAEHLRQENPQVKICTYNLPLSKAGYETLATPCLSPHSLPSYNNFCLQQTQMPFVFKWDADFLASPELLTYLNSRSWVAANESIKIHAVNSTHRNNENYIFPRGTSYVKYLFWEVPRFPVGIKILQTDSSVVIFHQSELTSLKSYWLRQPWFLTTDSDEARTVAARVNLLNQKYGAEPVGMARASNPECDPLFLKIKHSPEYAAEYSKW